MSGDPAPLTGVRVLDLSRVLAGPFCAALLADAGADVVKVEPPTGDDARHLGPFRAGESLYFDVVNRRKGSIALDLKDAADRDVLLRLVDEADVLVENYRPGVAERLGIGYGTLSRRNPRLVYASISGFGQSGPWAHAAAYDLVVQALAGLMSVTGRPDGGPTRVGESVGDLVAGVYAAWGISTALLERARTGRGRHLDVAMFDCLLSLEVTALSQLQASGRAPGRVGNRHPVSTPFDTYAAADGPFVLAVANEQGWQRFAAVLGRGDLLADPRFTGDEARTAHEPAVRELVEGWARGRTVAEVVEELSAAGLAASPIWDLGQAMGSEQTAARQLSSTFHHPAAGPVTYVEQPVVFLGAERPPVRRSPVLDEDGPRLRAGLDRPRTDDPR